MVLVGLYNKTVKRNQRKNEVHIMSKKIENALVTVVGAAVIWGSGWLILTVGDMLSRLVH